MKAQTKWRIAGGITIAACVLMAGYGAKGTFPRQSPMFFAIYWLVFLLLFIVSVGIALFDVRFVRLQYTSAKRELFHNTIGDESFRASLREATGEQPSPDRDPRRN